MAEPYDAVMKALAAKGINAQFQSKGQLVISQHVGLVLQERANSFWVTHVAGCWYLCTWSPLCYRVSASADIVELCAACMEFGTSAMPEVPEAIRRQFRLELVSEKEMEEVFSSNGR